jgi:hypothetical protein
MVFGISRAVFADLALQLDCRKQLEDSMAVLRVYREPVSGR